MSVREAVAAVRLRRENPLPRWEGEGGGGFTPTLPSPIKGEGA